MADVLPRLAWSLAVAAVVLVLADVVVAAQAVSLTSETAVAVHGFPFVDLACLGSALMGALIVSRYQRHPIGWLLSAIGVSTAVSLLAEAYAYWVLEGDGPATPQLGAVCAWIAQLFGGQIVVALIALMFLTAPDGHFVSRRWRRIALVPGTGALLCLAAILSVDPRRFDLLDSADRFGPVRTTLLSVGFSLISLGVLLGVVSMVLRMRRSVGEERQQLRLIAFAAALSAVGLVILAVGQAVNGGQQTWVSGVPLFVAFFLMPILFAVAALRYRLYDLDVFINRAVVVAAGAAFAAVGYTTLVVVAGQLLEGRTRGFWLSLVTTALVALAFQPLRRVVVRLANRAAYGARAQPYEALARFSNRLAAAPDPDDLLPAVAEAAARAVSGRGACATLDVPGAAPVSGTWGWWAPHLEGSEHVIPVCDAGRELGRIAVALPRGRDLRPADLRLLEALADQTAVAFGNTSLAGALADRVAQLDRTTRQLQESRLRLVAADDAGRRTLESAIVRDVLPFLAALPGEIARAGAAVAEGTDPSLDRLVEGTNASLEALRELTRGVFPAQLARTGLEPTLFSLFDRSRSGARFSVHLAGEGRWDARVESALYFCCAEVLRAGHPAAADLSGTDDELVLRVTGSHDGVDLRAVSDRVEAAGGSLAVSPRQLVLTVPVGRPVASTESLLVPGGGVPGG